MCLNFMLDAFPKMPHASKISLFTTRDCTVNVIWILNLGLIAIY